MWPALREGHSVLFVPIAPELLEVGDILVLKSYLCSDQPIWVVHRFLGRVGPFFLEAGDNSFTASLISKEQIAGKVVAVRDLSNKEKKLPEFHPKTIPLQLRPYLPAARAFLALHLAKNRLLDARKSLWLWEMSVLYRKAFYWFGLQLPVLPPAIWNLSPKGEHCSI